MRRFVSTVVAFLCVVVLYAAQYVVTADKLNLRTEPSKTAAVGATATAGDELNVVEVNGDWAKVEVGGQVYYGAVKYLDFVSEGMPEEVQSESPDRWESIRQIFNDRGWRHTSDVPLYLGLLLFVGFTIIYFFCDYDLFIERKDLFYIGSAVFMCLCVLEVVHFVYYDLDKTWFCSEEMGWWVIPTFLLFAFCCFIQAVMFGRLARAFHHHGGRNFSSRSGFILTVAAIVALGISVIFFTKYQDIVFYIDALAFAGWIGWLCYCNYRDNGSWLNVILFVGFWIVGMIATMAMYLSFTLLVITVLSIALAAIVGYGIIKMILNGASTPGSFFNLFQSSSPNIPSSSSVDTPSAPPSDTDDSPKTGRLRSSDGREVPVEFSKNGDTARATDFSGDRFKKNPLTGNFDKI